MAAELTPVSSKWDYDVVHANNVKDSTEVENVKVAGNLGGSLPGAEISEDAELSGLSLYEKKAIIVNREIDSQGMGRYQWSIFFLCGFGYLLDLLWAQAFGLVATPLQQELGFPDTQLGNIFTVFSAGLTAGAFVWGVLIDVVGRRWAFNCTVLCTCLFGLCLGAPSTYTTILVITAFIGFGVGGQIPIDTTITLEFLPQNKRWLLAMLSVFQPIGVILCSLFAYAFIPNYSCPLHLKSCYHTPPGEVCCSKADNYGWRYLCYTLGAITLGIFVLRFIVFRFQESPKFLLFRGQDEKAVKVLQHIARYNRRQCHVTLETFTLLTDHSLSMSSTTPVLGSGQRQAAASTGQKMKLELSRYKVLFKSTAATRLIVCVWIIYAFDYWGFTIAGSFLPTILARKGAALGLGLRETYRTYVYINLFGIPGVIAGTVLYRGRKLAMLVSSALFGASLFIFTVVNSEASYIGVNGLVYFFQSMFNAILYGWTPEAFEAPVRGTASGLASFVGRIFSIISPLIATHVLPVSTDGVLYLAGGGVFVSTIAVLFIPRQYLGRQSY